MTPDTELVRYGHAPGNYYCLCGDCKERYTGDKRSVTCRACAEKRKAKDSMTMTTPGATEAVTPDYERGFRDAQRLAAQIADERCKSDYAQWKDDVNWQQPFACNRVVRASMSIAAEIRALAPPDARASGASAQDE